MRGLIVREENAGLIYGNGHHMAQDLARVAVETLRGAARIKQGAP